MRGSRQVTYHFCRSAKQSPMALWACSRRLSSASPDPVFRSWSTRNQSPNFSRRPIARSLQKNDIHSFIHQVSIKHLLCARFSSRVLRIHNNEETDKVTPNILEIQPHQVRGNGENLQKERGNNFLPLIFLDFQFTWQKNDLNNNYFFSSIS